jgi:uncharacterized protein involved in propanediol utilization
MAAASQVPAGTWLNKGQVVELIELVNKAVAVGIVSAGSETVTVLLANLATERDAR